MKRICIFMTLMFTLLFCVSVSVMAEGNLKEVHCDEQSFSTMIPEELTAYWEDGNGLRISVGQPGYVPFVLVWRKAPSPDDGAEYLNGQYTQHIEAQYGNNLLAQVHYETYDIGGKSLPAAQFTYRVEGGTLCLLRLEEVRDDQTIEYTAKYINGDPDATMEALEYAVRYYQADEEKTAPAPPKTDDPSGLDVISCPEQEFSTLCDPAYSWVYSEQNGITIYTETEGSIPYVLVFRSEDWIVEAAEYIREQYTPHMREKYGDDLVAVTEYETYTIGGRQMPAALYKYRLQGYIIDMLRAYDVQDGHTVVFTAKYIQGEGDATLAALDTAAANYKPDADYYSGSADNAPMPEKTDSSPVPENTGAKNFHVVPSEASQVVYENYSDPSGYFTMDIPKGWQVVTGLKPSGLQDLISYAICLSDPSSPDRMLYFNLNTAGMLKSQEARDWYIQTYGPDSYFAQSPIAAEISAKGFFEGMAGLYDYSSFRTKEYVGTNILGGDVLRGEVVSSLTGNTAEGLFSAIVMDASYPVQRDPFNPSSGTIDAGILTIFDIIMETAPEGEFLDWQPVLDHCLSSVSFTSAFLTQREEAWRQVMGTSTVIMQTGSEMSDMIMDTWENAGRSSDILSQKQSDATLGYERVYDTESGDYLKAENGFTDWYDGSRYLPADQDDAYLSPVSGTIIWK